MNSQNTASKGSAGCGCFLLLFVGIAWTITHFIFPELPNYDETIAKGEVVSGKVTGVEIVENITINGKKPKRVVYSYGDGRNGSMMMAMKQSAKKGQDIQIRVLDGNAYPEGIRPFREPKWLRPLLIGGLVVAAIFFILGLLKLALIGGVLFAALKSKKAPKPGGGPPPMQGGSGGPPPLQ